MCQLFPLGTATFTVSPTDLSGLWIILFSGGNNWTLLHLRIAHTRSRLDARTGRLVSLHIGLDGRYVEFAARRTNH